MNIFLLQVPLTETTENAADSAKAVVTNFAADLVKDPNTTLQQLGEKAVTFGLKVVAALAVYLIGAWLIKRVKHLLEKACSRKNTDKTLASFISSFVSISLTILLIIITIGTLGVNTTSLAALLASAGVAIGMALSGTFQNFAGGLMIMLFKPFKAGDYIEALGYAGFVKEMSMVSTTLTTFSNNCIILPNGALFNGNINNFSKSPAHRIDWKINLAYGTDAQAAIDKMTTLINSEPRILNSKSGTADPVVVVNNLGDSAVEFIVRAWVKTEDYWGTLYDVNKLMYTELPKAGFSFPFPQMDVHFYDSKATTPASARKA